MVSEKKVRRDPLIYIIRWMTERGKHKINMAYTINGDITGKHVKLNNICEYLQLYQIINMNLFFYIYIN